MNRKLNRYNATINLIFCKIDPHFVSKVGDKSKWTTSKSQNPPNFWEGRKKKQYDDSKISEFPWSQYIARWRDK